MEGNVMVERQTKTNQDHLKPNMTVNKRQTGKKQKQPRLLSSVGWCGRGGGVAVAVPGDHNNKPPLATSPRPATPPKNRGGRRHLT